MPDILGATGGKSKSRPQAPETEEPEEGQTGDNNESNPPLCMKRPAAKKVVEPKPSEPNAEPSPEPKAKAPRAMARPATALPVVPEVDEEKPEANDGSRGQIVSTVELKKGWKLVVHRTPKGRDYKKWVSPDGKAFYSVVQAEPHGFEG